jgi:hydrophobic/amphiphilic exporter-1 (mainly G- bacteria), HAE1 family
LLEKDTLKWKLWLSSSGSDDAGSMFSLFSTAGSNIINMMMRLQHVNDRQRTVWEIADDMRLQIAQIPEIITATVSTTGGGMGMGGENTVDVEFYGFDFNTTNSLAEEIKLKLSKLPEATDITVSRKNDKPELQVILDKDKIALHGLNTAVVSTMIRNRISGTVTSRFKEEGDEYDIRVRLAEQYRSSITDLEELTILNPIGKKSSSKKLETLKNIGVPRRFNTNARSVL